MAAETAASFTEWLAGQTDRGDRVGWLAREAATASVERLWGDRECREALRAARAEFAGAGEEPGTA